MKQHAMILDWICDDCGERGTAVVKAYDNAGMRVELSHRAHIKRKKLKLPCRGNALHVHEREPKPGEDVSTSVPPRGDAA